MEQIEQAKIKQAKMTGWYDPMQLLSTARKTVLSTLVGEYADPRLGMADPTPGKFFDYSKQLRRLTVEEAKKLEDNQKQGDFEALEQRGRNDIWIDYVADVGDGWNPTYAVAYYLAQQTVKISEKDDLPRGEILIFGGDAVYPTASTEEYEQKLVTPYRMAFKASESKSAASSGEINLNVEPHVFALPGNHDWYDSLTAFKKVFCTHIFNGRKFAGDQKTKTGGWETRQKRSYFVLKLPHDWWLFGIDLQLSHNIDVTQLEYFESIVKEKMKRDDKVILCVPEPYWVKAIKYKYLTDKFEEKEKSIQKIEEYFEERGIDVKVYLAGDLHHYRRFEEKDKNQKITSGGGGAFLHPTHDTNFEKLFDDRRKEDIKNGKEIKPTPFIINYPDFKVSRRQDWKNFLFFWNNKWFGTVTAGIYAILTWLLYDKIKYGFSAPSAESVLTTINNLITTPPAALLILLMLGAVIFFTDTNHKTHKFLGGLLHGLAHLFAALALGWLGYFLVTNVFNLTNDAFGNFISFVLVIAVSSIGGYFIGSIIMGLYLFVSLHFLGRHDNEAFSALKIEDYKNFLRLHITKEALTIYPLKIEKVPREWTRFPSKGNDIEYYQPPAGSNEPELIETPIRVV
ncbi:MAG TPA: hypothetical protein VGB02_19800 [Pyrinomonadaceae bacterium]